MKIKFSFKRLVSIFTFLSALLFHSSMSLAHTQEVEGVKRVAKINELIEKINADILKARTRDDIKGLFSKLDKLYKDPANQKNKTFQLYYTVLSPLRGLEGIIWRLRPVVEKSDVLHTQVVELISTYYSATYMYGPHIKAVMDYLTLPTTKYNQFSGISGAQNYIEEVVLPNLSIAMAKGEKLVKDDDWDFFFDTYLLSGFDEEKGIRFLSSRTDKRYRIVTNDNLKFLLSGAYSARGSLRYVLNYNFNQMPDFLQRLLAKSAINNLKSKLRYMIPLTKKSVPIPQTPYDFVSTLKEKRFKKLLQIRKPIEEVQKNLDLTLNDYHRATQLELEAYKGSITDVKYEIANQYIVNPKELRIGSDDEIRDLEQTLKLYSDAKEGKTSKLFNEVTGRTFSVRLKSFFEAKKDLKVFLPNKFNIGKRGEYIPAGKDNQKSWAWNFEYGKSTNWPDPTFGNFIEANNSNLKTVLRDLRTHNATVFYTNFLPVP